MAWTQAVCSSCWHSEQGDRVPVRMRDKYREVETCCMCGKKTRDGIYIRRDSNIVPYPREDEDE